MTTGYPIFLAHSLDALFVGIEMLSANRQKLAPPPCSISLLDLHLLRPLLEQTEPYDPISQLLTSAELAVFRGFRYDKRRQEWLGGRVAAKHALGQMDRAKKSLTFLSDDCSILPDKHGRPQVTPRPPEYPKAAISISHSSGYAAALACPRGCCGIDIQQRNPSLFKVQERFASNEELATFGPALAPLTRLGLLWAAKEAVKKCLLSDHPSFFGAIRLNSIRYEPHEGVWTARCDLDLPNHDHAKVRMGEMGEHFIACAWGEGNA